MNKSDVDWVKRVVGLEREWPENGPVKWGDKVLELCSEIELWHLIAHDLYENDICDSCDLDECWDDCECPCHDEKYETRERASSFLRGWEKDE